MFELANRLVGIYKTFNCTKCVALSLENVDEAAAASGDATAAKDAAPTQNGGVSTDNNNLVASPELTSKIPSQSSRLSSSQSQSIPDNDAVRDDDF